MRSGQVISLVSGKGGVGKTNLAANLAVAAAGLDARVLLVDGDLGLSNVDVLLGLTPSRTSADLQSGRHDFEDVVLPGPHGVDLLPAASARMDLAAARPLELGWLLSPVRAATERYDLVLLDVGSGVATSRAAG